MNSIDSIKENKLQDCLTKAKEAYEKKSELYCPYFSSSVTLNADGLNHLQYKPNRMPRPIGVQVLKLRLLKKALELIPKIGTLQEYRDKMEKIGKRGKDGFFKTKRVQYWGFHAILDNKQHKIKIILKQVGDGKLIFWSVIPYDQKMYSEGIAED